MLQIKIVNWTSSDESIVAVNNAGKITGKKVGSAIITVTTQDGNKKSNLYSNCCKFK